MNKDLKEYKRKYDIARHHAWAGSILLSLVLALRIFLEISDISNIPDIIILPIGIALFFYILISLSYTYKYRIGIGIEQRSSEVKIVSDESNQTEINAKINKENLKAEKKKAKTETKKIKKSYKK
jgi:hypothetical protein